MSAEDRSTLEPRDRVRSLRERERRGMKFLLYGASGTGKTVTWSSWPKPILAVICSGAAETDETLSLSVEEFGDTVFDMPIYRTTELDDALEEFKTGDYASLVIDNLSGFQDLHVKEFLNLKEIPTSKSWGMAEQSEWGVINQRVQRDLLKLLSLDEEVVLIAHEREEKKRTDSPISRDRVFCSLSPATAAFLEGSVSYAGRMVKKPKMVRVKVESDIPGMEATWQEMPAEGSDYFLQVEGDGIYYTKFRVPPTYYKPRMIKDPTYDKIIRIIQGKYKEPK